MLPFFLTRARGARDASLDAALFEKALVHVLAMEGGWTDDPHDPGGPTNLGITLAEFARHRGVALDAENVARLKGQLRALTRTEAASIYRRDYWQAARCPLLPAPLAVFHFDAAVNQGVGGSARMLQRALAVAVDGAIGPATLAAAANADVSEVLAHYADVRRAHYRSLSTFWRFGRGWLARVDATLRLAHAIAADPRFHPEPNPQEISMTDSTATPSTTLSPSADAKWWGQSMTIWGVLVTTLSTVLPVLGPVIGLDITPDLVRQLGDGVIQVVQASGGLIGTALTVWGRLRASQPLVRTRVSLTL
jgi:lysozyme family protein